MLRKSRAAGAIRFKNKARRVGLFKPLTAASVLALVCVVALGPAQAESLPDHNGHLKAFNHNGGPDDFDRNGGSLKDFPRAPGCAIFHGFYHGYHVGTGSHDWGWTDRDAWAKEEDEAFPSFAAGTDNGPIGGLQAGFNWQRGCTVFGLEADWSWAGIDGTKIHTNGEDDDVALRVHSEIDGFGTLRTRAGIIMDNLLLYVTGGLAFANVDRSWTLRNDDDDDEVESFKSSETRFGWAAGFGAEWALTDRITIKSETLWLRFDDDSFTAFNNNDNHKDDDEERGGARFDLQDNLFVARIGMNFKFDSGALYPRWWP